MGLGFSGVALRMGLNPRSSFSKGFPVGDICKIISTTPAIFDLSVENNIAPSLSFLKGIIGSETEVVKVIKRCPRLLTTNLKNNLLVNVEFLKSCGIAMERIRMIFESSPGCLTVKPELMRDNSEKAKEMGLNPASLSFVYAISVFSKMSDEALELKLQSSR